MRQWGNRLRDLPAWLPGVHKISEGTEVHAIGHISDDSDSERPTKVASKKRRFFSLPERPTLRSLLANQNDKGSLQETGTRW